MSTTRCANSRTFGVIPGISAMTITAGPVPLRNTARVLPSAVKSVRSKLESGASSIEAARGVVGFVDDGVLEHADAFDLDADDVAVGQQGGRRAGDAHPAGRARGDDVAGLQGEGRRQVLDHLPAVEDELVGGRVLTEVVADPGAQAEAVRVAELVGGHEPRP